MTMSPARRLSSALQGGFFSKFHVPVEQFLVSCKCSAPWLLRPIMAFFHVLYECEKLGYFYILPPRRANEPPIREARIQIGITPSSFRKYSSKRI